MNRCLLIVLCLISAVNVARADERVVLVVSADSPIEEMSSFEIRKLYLGIEVVKAERFVRGLRNSSMPLLESIFLQSVVGLTAQRYEDRLLSNLVKYGSIRPTAYSDVAALKQALLADEFAVSYLMISGEEELEGLRVLRVLWQEF